MVGTVHLGRGRRHIDDDRINFFAEFLSRILVNNPRSKSSALKILKAGAFHPLICLPQRSGKQP